MDVITRFAAYADDFEKTFADDDWSRLRQYFTDDAVYEGVGSEAFSFKVEGIDAVLAHLKTALDGFDRKFATRTLELTSELAADDDRVSFDWKGIYTVEGAPALDLIGSEEAIFEGDKIKHLTDTFDSDNADDVNRWMGTHGALLGS